MNYTIDYYFDLQSIDNENVVDILKNIIDSNNISDEPLDYQFEILDNETQEIIFKGGEATTSIPYRYFEEVADYLTHRKREVEEERNNFLDSLFKPTKPKEEEESNSFFDSLFKPTKPKEEEERNSFIDSLFKPTKPKEEEVVENAPVDISETTNEIDLSPSPQDVQNQTISHIMDTQTQESPPMMDTQLQESPSMMDTQTQESPPMMDTQTQESPPMMDTQIQQQQVPMVDVQNQQQVPMVDTQAQQQQQPPVLNNQIYQGGNVKSSIITVRIIIQKMNSLPFLFLKKMRYKPQYISI
uniref:Uncharacterized protein n=1 Tax=viral metagenome TaxID=1070528 RepID=A0A6C0KK04_9ZZZZ